jgi:acetylornithine deacetylase/succinyl-diaminopimelate desuccinylase-like protein
MDVIDLTKKLISIESISGNEKKISQFISEQLDSDHVEMQSVEGFGPNIIAEHIPEPEKPIVLLNCHMDTVGIMEGWESDPIKPYLEENKLFGLGSSDMKAGCAIAIDAFNNAKRLGKNAIFTAVSDEEGNSVGSHVLLQKLMTEDLKNKMEIILCLIPEDTHETVKLGARGRYVIEITVTGHSAHGATPKIGTNAILGAGKILDALGNLPLNSHPQMGSGSSCVLKIEGGGDSLSVPDKCVIRVDRHTILGEDKAMVKRDLEELLKTLKLKCTYKLSFMKRRTPFLEPYILDPENPQAARFLSSYREFYNREPEIGYGRSVGDFNAFGNIMPTIVFGPKGENAHAPNECVYIDSVKRCKDFYVNFIQNLS